MRFVFPVLGCLTVAIVAIVACVGSDPAPSDPREEQDAGTGTDATTTSDGTAPPDTGVDARPPPPAVVNETSFAYHLPTTSTSKVPVAIGEDGYVVVAANYYEAPAGLPNSPLSTAIAIVLLDAGGKPVWSKGIVPAGPGDFAPSGIALDAAGDIYLAGTGEPSVDFGGGVTFTTNAKDFGFLVKLRRSDGQGVWGKRFVSPSGAVVSSLALRGDSIVVGGKFFQEISIDKTDGTKITLSDNDVPMFVAALDRASGNARWAKKASAVVTAGPPVGELGGASLDDAGNVYLGGTFRGTLSGLGAPLVMIGDQPNGFVASLGAATGDARWGIRFGSATGTAGASVLALSASASSSVVAVGGQVPQATDFGDGKPVGTTGTSDAYVATFDASNGAPKWKLVVGGDDGGSDGEGVHGVAIDPWDQVVAVGDYRRPFAIGSTTLPKPPDISGSPSNPSRALFGTKLDATGTPVWTKAVTAGVVATGRSVAARPSGSFAVGAWINGGNVNLGVGTPVTPKGSDLAVLGWTP